MRAVGMTLGMGVWLVALAGAAGCSSGGSEPLIAGRADALPEGEDSAAFLDRISSQARVTENDAMRGMLMLLDGKDACKTFEERVKSLAERRVVDRSWEFGSHRPVTKGKLAYMIYQACKVRGGVVVTLMGPTQRYCLRELEYQRFISEGTIYTDVTGMEFLAVVSRADAYMREGKVPEVMVSGTGSG